MVQDAAERYVDKIKEMAGRVADLASHGINDQPFTLSQQVEAWNKRNINVDPLELQQQGMSPVDIRDQVFPLRAILLKKAGINPIDRVRYSQKMQDASQALSADE